jgi:hypothetical protein
MQPKATLPSTWKRRARDATRLSMKRVSCGALQPSQPAYAGGSAKKLVALDSPRTATPSVKSACAYSSMEPLTAITFAEPHMPTWRSGRSATMRSTSTCAAGVASLA